MSLALELDQDQRSTLEDIWKQRQAKGQARPPMTLPPEPKPEAKPEPAAEAKPRGYSRTPAAAAERRTAFLATIKAKFAEGAMVTIAAAAEAAGVHHVTAGEHIQKLRSRGEWPFGAGRRGGARTPKAASPVERPAPPPLVVAEAKPEPRQPAVISHIEAIESWSLGYHLGIAVERIAGGSLEDLKKSVWHINREIARREGEGAAS